MSKSLNNNSTIGERSLLLSENRNERQRQAYNRLTASLDHEEEAESLSFIEKIASLPKLTRNFFYKVLLQKTVEDDAVSVGTKQFLLVIIFSIMCWMISYVLVFTHIIKHERCTEQDWPLFVPMWIGSWIGMLGCVIISFQVCKTVTFVTKQRRLYMIAQGIANHLIYVDYESLPLMRRLFCWSVVSFIAFALVMVAQLLFYRWFGGMFNSLIEALVPTIFVIIVFMCYMFAMNIFSIKTCIMYSLACLEVVLVALKIKRHISGVQWLEVSTPLILLLVLSYCQIFYFIWQSFFGKYLLQTWQKISLGLYLLGLLLMSGGCLSTIYLDWSDTDEFDITIPYRFWRAAIPVVVSAGLITLFSQGYSYAHCRGYSTPLLLSRTSKGWEPVETGNPIHTWFLGTISTPKETISTNAKDVTGGSLDRAANNNSKYGSTATLQASDNRPNPLATDIESLDDRDDASYSVPQRKQRLSEIELSEITETPNTTIK